MSKTGEEIKRPPSGVKRRLDEEDESACWGRKRRASVPLVEPEEDKAIPDLLVPASSPILEEVDMNCLSEPPPISPTENLVGGKNSPTFLTASVSSSTTVTGRRALSPIPDPEVLRPPSSRRSSGNRDDDGGEDMFANWDDSMSFGEAPEGMGGLEAGDFDGNCFISSLAFIIITVK